MHKFTVTDVEASGFTQDRNDYEIALRAESDTVHLTLDAKCLEVLITELLKIEHLASLLDPVNGPRAGEATKTRATPVQSYQVRVGGVGSTPSLFVGLQSTQRLRWFAFDKPKAQALLADLQENIARVGSGIVKS